MNSTTHPPDRVIHVGLPVRCAGTIQVGNVVHIDREAFVVVKVGGAAFDMVPRSDDLDEH